MKSKLAFSLIFILVFVLMPTTIVAAEGQKGEYAWVLVDIQDYEQSVIKSTEENFEFTYTFEYSRGSYSVRSVYDGESREVFEVKYVHGETYGARCEFDEPPQTIGIGETVTLDVSMMETENTLSGWAGLAHGYAKFVDAEQSFTGSSSSDISFRDNTDSAENWRQTLDTLKGISFVETKITAIPPEGKRGDRITLRFVFNISSLAMGTDYIYELKENIPVHTGPGKETQPGEPADSETDGNETGPWEHAGVGATIVIGLVSSLAAIFGGAIGSTSGGASAAENNPQERDVLPEQDPAYERRTVPDYPAYKTGLEGEHLSKMPNGTIEVSYPSGELAIHFPNGTVQLKRPDGSTQEEWPDGTVTASDEEGFYIQKPDGTQSHSKPNGDEITYNPDGTSIEKTNDGAYITRDESNNVTKYVNKSGNVAIRHPVEPDAFLVSSPHGGSLTYRRETKWVHRRTADGQIEYDPVDHMTIEGSIRTEDMSLTFKPDGSMEGQGDDGSRVSKDSEDNWKVQTAEGDAYEKYADGQENYQGADGSSYRANPNTGEVEAQLPDGSYVKGNTQTGEVDARLPDGSFAKRDAQGKGSFVDKESGLRGEYQSDGSLKHETDDASLTQTADGTQEFKTKTGVQVTQKPDGTVTTRLPDGRSSLNTPDGAEMVKMPDGTTFKKSTDGGTQIQRPDGSVQQTTQQDYDREMARYNDWYNKQLEQWLKKQG